MVILDTDTLSHLHTGNQNIARHLQKLTDPDVGTTVINKSEILRGRIARLLKADNGYELLVAQRLLLRSEELLAQLNIIPISVDAANLFSRFRMNKKIKKIGNADLMIASIAVANRALLVTRNVRHFQPIPNLRVVNWVD